MGSSGFLCGFEDHGELGSTKAIIYKVGTRLTADARVGVNTGEEENEEAGKARRQTP